MATQPSSAWWDQQLPNDVRALGFVGFAVDQVERLAPLLPDESELSGAVRAACIESFWVNVRLLAEFLVKGTDSRDWRSGDFVSGWSSVDLEAKKRLLDAWTLASRHVMHLSKDRTPPHLPDVAPVSDELYMQVARDCRTIYDEFDAARERTAERS
ncbi:hypothetical protein [Streptomyces sp. NPDC047974]|uniref:hypothetical protein n=1 Tax=Streptomyces sp. NPDC047974 TaxID=3154343 RepID=UPI0033D1D393